MIVKPNRLFYPEPSNQNFILPGYNTITQNPLILQSCEEFVVSDVPCYEVLEFDRYNVSAKEIVLELRKNIRKKLFGINEPENGKIVDINSAMSAKYMENNIEIGDIDPDLLMAIVDDEYQIMGLIYNFLENEESITRNKPREILTIDKSLMPTDIFGNIRNDKEGLSSRLNREKNNPDLQVEKVGLMANIGIVLKDMQIHKPSLDSLEKMIKAGARGHSPSGFYHGTLYHKKRTVDIIRLIYKNMSEDVIKGISDVSLSETILYVEDTLDYIKSISLRED